jgi:hypothetical protein
MSVYGVGECGNGYEKAERSQQNDILHVEDPGIV